MNIIFLEKKSWPLVILFGIKHYLQRIQLLLHLIRSNFQFLMSWIAFCKLYSKYTRGRPKLIEHKLSKHEIEEAEDDILGRLSAQPLHKVVLFPSLLEFIENFLSFLLFQLSECGKRKSLWVPQFSTDILHITFVLID